MLVQNGRRGRGHTGAPTRPADHAPAQPQGSVSQWVRQGLIQNPARPGPGPQQRAAMNQRRRDRGELTGPNGSRALLPTNLADLSLMVIFTVILTLLIHNLMYHFSLCITHFLSSTTLEAHGEAFHYTRVPCM